MSQSLISGSDFRGKSKRTSHNIDDGASDNGALRMPSTHPAIKKEITGSNTLGSCP